MKKHQLFSTMAVAIMLLCNGAFLKAQVTIGSEAPPHSFSVLELTTNLKQGGLRLPQIPTTKDRDAISNAHGTEPAMMGLEIFNLETNCVNTWNGFSWIEQCAPAPTLEVDPTGLIFTADAGGGGDQTVTVTTSLPSWSVTDSPVWVSLSASGNTLTVGVPNANSGDTPLTGEITIKAGTLTKTVSVTQNMDLANLTNTLVATNTYLGAFWRHNQTGERIIRIPVVSTESAGTWSASVGWYDSQWNPAGGDGIVFSTDATSDPGVTFAAGDNPGNAENYQVTGSITVSGTVANGQTVMFRIGLQKQFTAYKPDDDANPNPARYAVVLLRFGNPAKVQELFIRQGEGADYVMRNEDPIDPNGPAGLSERTQCVKFVPYNLTAANLNTQIAVNGGVFTDYPSQSGALFQWASLTTSPVLRYAFDAFSASPPVWSPNSPASPLGNDLWNTYGDTNETCPEGYRRPNEGPTDAFVNYLSASEIALSEIRQSLYKSPQIGAIRSSENGIPGYYADGFFDRRQITNGAGTGGATNSSVSSGNNSVANIGYIFYNPYTNASLFFPIAGVRFNLDGSLSNMGMQSRYWTTSRTNISNTNTSALNLTNGTDSFMSSPSYLNGNSVRCVKK